MKKKRYRRQLHNWDCTILALINSLIFLKKEFSFNPQYAWFLYLLDPETGKDKEKKPGVTVAKFSKFVTAYFKKVKIKGAPSLKYLYSNFKKDKLIILGAEHRGINHVGVVTKMTKKHVYLANWGSKYPVERRFTWKEASILMQDFSTCWVVDKE